MSGGGGESCVKWCGNIELKEHILAEKWLQYSRTDKKKRCLMATCGEGSLEACGELQTGLNRGFTVDDAGNGAFWCRRETQMKLA